MKTHFLSRAASDLSFSSKAILFRRVSRPPIPVKIEIAFVVAPPYCAFSLKSDAAHISINAVIAQAEGGRQFLAAKQPAILHIGALQNIDPVMPAVVFDFLKSETCLTVERSADHLVKNPKEKRSGKRDLGRHMQALSIRLYAYSYGFFYQAYGFLARDIFDHLQIDRRPREDHPFGVQFFLLRKLFIFVAQFVAEVCCIIDESVGLLLAEFASQLTQEIREAAELFIIFFIDHTAAHLRF